jgi:two-component system sensor kinase
MGTQDESEARLDAIVHSAMDGIITIDAGQRIVLFNAAAERMFGCAAADAIGGPLDRFLPERFRAAHRQHIERFIRTGETSRRMGLQQALAGLRADGREFPLEASISQATVGGQRLMTVILRDISERVRAEQQLRGAHEELRQLSIAMPQVREAERTRIARELHDELGQALTALKMDVDLLDTLLPADAGEMRERTAAMRSLFDATVATTRRRASPDLTPLPRRDCRAANPCPPGRRHVPRPMRCATGRRRLRSPASVGDAMAALVEPVSKSPAAVLRQVPLSVERRFLDFR